MILEQATLTHDIERIFRSKKKQKKLFKTTHKIFILNEHKKLEEINRTQLMINFFTTLLNKLTYIIKK